MMLPVLYLSVAPRAASVNRKGAWERPLWEWFEEYGPASVINQLTCADQASPSVGWTLPRIS